MGKSDRTLVWGIFCLLLGAGIAVEPYAMYGVYGVLIGLLWSTARRIRTTLLP